MHFNGLISTLMVLLIKEEMHRRNFFNHIDASAYKMPSCYSAVCDHNTAGVKREKCAVGYYGDATKGTFSRICKLDTDGRPTCTSCQPGYTGRNCESCPAWKKCLVQW
ncbi:unnamed protein product [Porites lobata]|uniref:Laminin EGF-like domain-containing protein n=1 Tax=Porites lobata TaxID=104759 RepID=A0ABN8S063_9CNID|nr:unnamed protein product [Porites lobata]